MFLYYHEAWVAEKIKLPPRAACVRTPAITIAFPSACELLLNPGTSSTTNSSSSLVDWCSFFIPPRDQKHMTKLQWHRWLVCIHGALSQNAFMLIELGVSSRKVSQLCEHDLPWHTGDWNAVEKFCKALSSPSDLLFSKKSYYPARWNQTLPIPDLGVDDLLELLV